MPVEFIGWVLITIAAYHLVMNLLVKGLTMLNVFLENKLGDVRLDDEE